LAKHPGGDVRVLAPSSSAVLIIAVSILSHLFCNFSHAASTAIPTTAIALKNTQLPAEDLIFEGKPLDPDKAVDLRKSGFDLSTLNPIESDVWQNRSYPASDEETHAYPPATDATLAYHRIMPLNPDGWFRSQVSYENKMFRMSLSLNVHQALMRAALLRKMGYPVQSPRWIKNLTLTFPDKKSKETFIKEISVQAGGVDHKRWVTKEDPDSNQIQIQDAMLEPAQIIVPTSFYLGNINATHIKGRRALRALIEPFVILDVPEDVNTFTWEMGQIINENIILTHKYADAFSETTFDDIRWFTSRIVKLTRADFQEIVQCGQLPPDISAVILEKLIAGRNRFLKFVDKQRNVPNHTNNLGEVLPYTTQINFGYVVAGKATREKYSGYALRFTHGDPDSPLRMDDVTKFLKIEVLTGVIKQATSILNEKLQFWTVNTLMEKRANGLRNDFLNHIKTKPFEPYNQPISVWHGPIGGFSVSASRNIATGSYYGIQSSDFNVSLVDQITAAARIGYLLGIDGIPQVIPGMNANLILQRSYAHIRPIPSMEAADSKQWNDLWVPGFMDHLAESIDRDLTSKDPAGQQKEMAENLKAFLENLKEGENFTITDSIGLSEQNNLNVPLAALLSMPPVAFSNTAIFGTNSLKLILRRTTFTRENGLLKIYLQNVKSGLAEGTFDFNWWMNITRQSKSNKWGEAKTRAFHLDETPTDSTIGRDTVLAILGILRNNNSEILENRFHPYQLDHNTESQISQGKFLLWRWSDIEESHVVKIQPPKRSDINFDPAKFERTFFSHRILERTGKNYYAFLSDILDGAVQNSHFWKPGLLDSRTGSNPKDSFMGSAKWSTINTEAEITAQKQSPPVTIVENFWAGWDLPKNRLFNILDEIDGRLQSLHLSLPLIDRDGFNDMKRLQLFEIRSTFIVYEEGMKRIRDSLLIRDNQNGSFLQKLIGWDNTYSGSDVDVVEKVLIPLYSRERFTAACKDLSEKQLASIKQKRPPSSTTTVANGQSYPCILPWMIEVLKLRRHYPDNREEQIKWATRLMAELEKNVPLSDLMNWFGKENFYFQIKISGFRTNDESGDTADYKSSTVGMISNKNRAGIFRDLVSDYQIMSSELNASYLTEGY
jgi:hypothetical protein